MLCLLLSVFTTEAFCADSGEAAVACAAGGDTQVASRFGELIFGKQREKRANEEIYLCPGGDAFGVKILGGGVAVSKVIDEVASKFKENDVILKINDQTVNTAEDVKQLLRSSGGEALRFEVLRSGKSTFFSVTPKLCATEYHLGVILKDSTSGIGTVTYYNPKTHEFGGLGHGITSGDGKQVARMTEGTVTGVILAGAAKGEAGKPGELRGVLTDTKLGEIYANTECGVFGTLDAGLECTYDEPMPVARKNEVREGEAIILTTVKSGKRAAYKIEIESIDYSSTSTKSFKVRVTDSTLLTLTGGIVRGMSGSPIIQDGKLVGAVTHVLVANPTEGYGIFIENMLNASEIARNELPKAA